jgi:hypothetical protein
VIRPELPTNFGPFWLRSLSDNRFLSSILREAHLLSIDAEALRASNRARLGLQFVSVPATNEREGYLRYARWTESDGFDRFAVVLVVVWAIALAPWALFASPAGMASEAGYVPEAYVLVIAIWTYPITVAAACFGRRRVPLPVFQPITSLLGI